MAKRKVTKKYYFSVEGETEQWYLKRLQELINTTEDSSCNVSFDCPIQKNPIKRAKSLVITGKTEIYHISDYESADEMHVKGFQNTIDNLKDAKNVGKQINYKFGYSNLTFDLWIILHKIDCRAAITHRKNYVSHLNRAYGENFENMDAYKHEVNFKRCLQKISLSDVIAAISRAKEIMKRNEENGYVLQQYKGYTYYRENPSLMIWEPIEKILKDCALVR